jgi:hypothetical protein
LRTFLQACPDRRQHPRRNCRLPLRVYPIFSDLELAEPIAGMASDISLEGISLRVPHRPTTSYFYVHFNTSEPLSRWVILARVVRIESKDDGWFEVGAEHLFLTICCRSDIPRVAPILPTYGAYPAEAKPN